MTAYRACTSLRCRAALVFVLGVIPLVSLAAPKPAVVGDWNGVLDVGQQGKLHLVVHVTLKDDGSLTGTMDSPDQGTTGIAITAITFKEGALHFECSDIGGAYEGKMNKGNAEIDGTWSQSGNSLALNLMKSK